MATQAVPRPNVDQSQQLPVSRVASGKARYFVVIWVSKPAASTISNFCSAMEDDHPASLVVKNIWIAVMDSKTMTRESDHSAFETRNRNRILTTNKGRSMPFKTLWRICKDDSKASEMPMTIFPRRMHRVPFSQQ